MGAPRQAAFWVGTICAASLMAGMVGATESQTADIKLPEVTVGSAPPAAGSPGAGQPSVAPFARDSIPG